MTTIHPSHPSGPLTGDDGPDRYPLPYIDPGLEAVMPDLRAAFPEPLTSNSLPALRSDTLAYDHSDEQLSRDGAFDVTHVVAPGLAGAPDVAMVVCTPTGSRKPSGVLYFMHGGGMVIGSHLTMAPWVMDIAQAEGLAVVSVNYRLAPETRHPGPVEDCFAGLQWIAEHGGDLGLDATRIVAVGESAGAGLAAGLGLVARDADSPVLIGQLLACPMLDDRNDSASAVQVGEHGCWTRASNEFAWDALLGDLRGRDDVRPPTSPARAADLSGLPATFIDIGSAEVFRDEAVDYANRIWLAGGRAELHVWAGGLHGYDYNLPTAAISERTQSARADWIHRLLG